MPFKFNSRTYKNYNEYVSKHDKLAERIRKQNRKKKWTKAETKAQEKRINKYIKLFSRPKGRK